MDRRARQRLNPGEAKARLRAAAGRSDPLVRLGWHPTATAGFVAGVLSALSHRSLVRLAAGTPRVVLLGLGLSYDVQRARRLLDEHRRRS